MRTQKIPRQTFGPNGERLCRWCKTEVKPPRRTFCSEACVHEAMLRSDSGYLRKQTKKRDKGVCACCGRDTEKQKDQYRRLRAFSISGFTAYERSERKIEKRYGITRERWSQVRSGIPRDEYEAHQLQIREQEIEAHARLVRRHTEMPHRYPAPEPLDEQYLQIRLQLRTRFVTVIDLEVLERQALRVERRFIRLAKARLTRVEIELRAEGFHDFDSNLWQADHIQPVAEGGGACGLENIQTLCTPCHKRKTAEQARRKALIRRGIDPDNPPPDPQLSLL